MLRELPFKTIGDVARCGLELHVYCPRCHATRRQPIDIDESLHEHNFAKAKFRCRSGRANGEVCGCPGAPQIRPTKLLPVGGKVTLAFLHCRRCVWQIDQVQLDQPPWSASTLGRGDRYRCPGCLGQVDWHIHGPAWRPTYDTPRG
jgi:hypothetical protein